MFSKKDKGRDVDTFLADFHHELPRTAVETRRRREPRLFDMKPARGPRHAGQGWSPSGVPVSVWRMTSDQAPVLWPFVASPALPPTGAQMGIDFFSGSSMYFDPNAWVKDDEIPVTNSNVLVQGKPCEVESPLGYQKRRSVFGIAGFAVLMVTLVIGFAHLQCALQVFCLV